ncbi:MAG TPA: response regulator [Lacipirellulaceae bacterium]|jgi:FixJ family two-component response regulator
MTPADTTSPTVFVVDDDEQMRDSLEVLLEVVGFAVRPFASPGSFQRYYRPQMPGCLLLDIRMPRQDGLALYEQLLSAGKRLPMIFITVQADALTPETAMRTGAIELLEKPFDREMLVDRVRKALALDAQWRQRDADIAALEERVRRLSDRERETLEMIEAGQSNKAMAAKLFLTERAVEMHRSAIMRKLQVGSMAELVDLTATPNILAELRTAAGEAQFR